jgi:hypothetical protein
MRLDVMEALGLEVRGDGRDALVVLRHGAVEAWIERMPKDRNRWKAVNVRGKLFVAHSGSRLLDMIADNLSPRT